MMKQNSCIGGEQSGHIILSNNSYCGDGLLTALQILEILNQQKCKLSELCNDLFIKVPPVVYLINGLRFSFYFRRF